MVIYEVLSGRAPFSQLKHYIVISKVMDGEQPERPKGVKGVWFTDELWQMVTWCWATEPENRPSIIAVLECLERVPRDLELPLQVDGDLGMDEDDWDLASNSSSQLSWFDPYCFVELLCEVLCYGHIFKPIGKFLSSKRSCVYYIIWQPCSPRTMTPSLGSHMYIDIVAMYLIQCTSINSLRSPLKFTLCSRPDPYNNPAVSGHISQQGTPPHYWLAASLYYPTSA